MIPIRVCRACGLEANTESELKDFCKDSANKTGYSTICRSCNNARRLAYQLENSDKVKKSRRARAVEKKIKAINYKGGCCHQCGLSLEDSHHSVFDFHHLDPSEKEHHPSDLVKNSKWADIQNEIDKCILVCANCHRIIHHKQDDNYYKI